MKEIWKDIKGYEGYYQVSSFGRVRALNRVVNYKDMYGNISKRFIKGKMLKTCYVPNSYPSLSLSIKNVVKHHSVHRFVAQAFVPNPLKKEEVNHIDSNRENNHVSNLEWCTHAENMEHTIKSGKGIFSLKKRHKYITLNGITKTYTEWAEETGIPVLRIRWRVLAGQKPEDILKNEVRVKGKRGEKWKVVKQN